MRKVTRTWTNKKTGQTITKEYTYKNNKSRKGYVLVDKKGRLRKNNIEKYKQMIETNEWYTEAEKRMVKEDLDNYIKVRRDNIKAMLLKEKKAGKQLDEITPLTTRGFEGHEQKDGVERMFANAGLTAAEVAKDIGIDELDILNPANWQDGLLVINGIKYAFNHNYTGDALEVVNE